MPSRENDTSMSGRFSANMGNNKEIIVTTNDNSTVFFLPILFISTPVGTEKMRNQKKTNDGMVFAMESLSPRSAFT